ncbi:MAG: hypothetical protein IJE91_01120 [Clostridia bacterium]|nr:hypothetical protein [Clostridia bacterium]
MAKKADEVKEVKEDVKVTSVKKKVAKPAPAKTEEVKEVKTEVKEPLVADSNADGKVSVKEDVADAKRYAWLSYILFFIPMLINANSPFVRHHANEGLEINIFDFIGLTLLLVGALVQTTVAAVHFLMIIFTLVGIGLLVLTTITKIYMIWATLKGETVTTPWMWDIRIIK